MYLISLPRWSISYHFVQILNTRDATSPLLTDRPTEIRGGKSHASTKAFLSVRRLAQVRKRAGASGALPDLRVSSHLQGALDNSLRETTAVAVEIFSRFCGGNTLSWVLCVAFRA